MRRPIAAIAGTVAGLAALLSYKSGAPPARLAGTSSPAATAPTTGDTTPTPGDTGSAPSTTSAPTPTTSATRRSVTGSLVPTRYGDVQVKATVQGSRLVDVTAVQLPSDRARSAQISNQAAPLLRQEALAAQSANIDGVSGATYTSQGYAESLQSALDAARQG